MQNNINTQEYWEQRFSSGDWEANRGRWQTASFARGHLPYLGIPRNFAGVMLDFGCGLGDAMPIYRESFPKARLMGVDISPRAIELCQQKYGNMATFMQGDFRVVPPVDIIIASNVLEHLSQDRAVVRTLLSRCKDLYIIVPYKEWPLYPEHVNTYDENYFPGLSDYEWKVFPCEGWSSYGRHLWYEIRIKNIVRYLLGRQLLRRAMQIMFHFRGLLK